MLSVEGRALVRHQRPPVGDRGVEGFALGRHRPTFDIGEGRIVGCDEPRPRAALDGEVAERHAPGHVQRPHGFACVLDHISRTAARPDLADDVEGHVLGGDAGGQGALHADAHGLGLHLDQGLGGEHVLHL